MGNGDGQVEGFTKLSPSVVFVVAIIGSMAGLAYAMRNLPIGTAYAVWVGNRGGSHGGLRDGYRRESASPLKAVFLVMIIGGVVGLKLIALIQADPKCSRDVAAHLCCLA